MLRELLEVERLARLALDDLRYARFVGECNTCEESVDMLYDDAEESTVRELELALVQLDLARSREGEAA